MTEDVFRWVVAAAVILACAAFLVQAGVAVALYRIAKQTQGKIVPLADRAEPILDAARGILDENRPRILEISGEAVAVAKTARQQAEQWSVVLDDAAGRARVRIAQIDETVDETVQHVEDVSGAVKGAVLRPVREANGLLAGLKAAVATYVQGGRRSSVDHATQDEEMFI
jgi:hypothetical protein